MTRTGTNPFERPARYVNHDDPTERSPYFPSFLEKLVVAIVRAYPARPSETEDERHKRVREAVDALSGRPPRKHAPTSYDLPETFNAYLTVNQNGVTARDRNDLPRRLSARLHHEVDMRDFAMDEPRDFSLTQLAERAIAKGRSSTVFAQTVRKRLAQFSYRNYLMDVLHRRVEQEEAEMKTDLDLIAEILDRWNVRADIDPIALALASFWVEAEDTSGKNPTT